MVNFNNETTISTPAIDIVKVIWLQRRYDVLEALESYNKHDLRNQEIDLTVVSVRLKTFFYEIQGLLLRQWDEKKYNEIKNKVNSHKIDDLLGVIEEFNVLFDKIRLTRIDLKNEIDTRRTRQDDKERD